MGVLVQPIGHVASELDAHEQAISLFREALVSMREIGRGGRAPPRQPSVVG
jgi:hypothetical protein